MTSSDTPAASAARRIARAAGTVMAAFILSNLIGLVRQILTANAYGTQADIDAFNAANRVSETLFNLIAGGALASAFIPTFTALLAKGDKGRAWRLASALANLALLALTVTAILAAVFAPQIVHYVLAPGFSADPQQEALAINLLRLMLPAAIFFGLSGLVMGILNSHQIFFLPALAPAMYQVGMIFGILVLSPTLGIYGLAWGVLLGAAGHLLIQLPSLLRLGGHYTPGLGLESPDIREVARLMLPRLLGVAVVQLNFWVNTRLASRFTEGSVTGLVLAFSLLMTPISAIAQSIAIAAMPTFSAQAALQHYAEMRASLSTSLRWALLLAIPATVGMIMLRTPLVTMLYQRGAFTADSTQLVAWALLWYVAGLVGHSLVEILSRAFYSLHDTLTPVMVGVAAMSLNVVFSYAFAAGFAWIGWMPHGGLALANSTATGLEALALLFIMRGRLNGLDGRAILGGILQSGLASLAMGLALWGWLGLSAGRSTWLVSLGGVFLGALVFGLVGLLLGMPELRLASRALRRRAGV